MVSTQQPVSNADTYVCTVVYIFVKRYKKCNRLDKKPPSPVSGLDPLGALLHKPALHKGLAQYYKPGAAGHYEAEGWPGPFPLEY